MDGINREMHCSPVTGHWLAELGCSGEATVRAVRCIQGFSRVQCAVNQSVCKRTVPIEKMAAC